MRAALRRAPIRREPPRHSSKVFPAPVAGWITNEAKLSTSPLSARIMDNYFPEERSVRPRKGHLKYATLDDEVTSLMVYRSGGSKKLFAATPTSLYDITTNPDPDVIPTPDVTGQTSGYYSRVQFSVPGGEYFYAVNGSDDPLLYDGTSWISVNDLSVPISITPDTVPTHKFDAVWAHASRLWFVEKGTMTAWYLPAEQVGGTATPFYFSGVFNLGGALLFGTSWSLDAGDGMDDKCVFVTDAGEVAVYSGINPSDPNNWRLEGVYRIARPLGKLAWYKQGGMPFIATLDGIVPLGEVLKAGSDYATMLHITERIEDQWYALVEARSSEEWQTNLWEERNMLIVCSPVPAAGGTKQAIIGNVESTAWCRYTGVNYTCSENVFEDGYVGTKESIVYQMETTGYDDGAPYNTLLALSWDHLDAVEMSKTLKQARATFVVETKNVIALLSASTDYEYETPVFPSAVAPQTGDRWDVGRWDEARWSGSEAVAKSSYTTLWQSIGRTGYAHSIVMTQTFGDVVATTQELVSIVVTFEVGELVV